MINGYNSSGPFNSEGWRLENGVLDFASDIEVLEDRQFAGRKDIKAVLLHSGISSIGEECFSECPTLERLELPDSLEELGVAAFSDCTALRRLELPPKLQYISPGAFLNCESLEKLGFSPGLLEIDELAFQNCGISEADIPETVIRVGDEAFFSCPNLSSVNLPNPAAEIGRDAFGGNYELVRGYIGPGFPQVTVPGSELLYSMLWASCPDRHGPETGDRAARFILNNTDLVMEWVIKHNNVPALTGIVNRCLLPPDRREDFLKQTLRLELRELTALLMAANAGSGSGLDEFEL